MFAIIEMLGYEAVGIMPRELIEREEYCPSCGQYAEGEPVCPNCGAILKNNEDDEFDGFHEQEDDDALDDDL